MARGWESKGVEEQIDAAAAARTLAKEPRKTPDQLRREAQIESLELNRCRVLRDFEAASNPRYREMLTNTLKFLDDKIAALKTGG